MDSLKTIERLDGSQVKQFSIFLENRVGALLSIVRVLNEHHVDVLALNIQDSADSAIVRVVVSDPETVQGIFRMNDIPYSVTEFVVVELTEGAESLGKMLNALLMAEVNIHGSYALLTRPNGKPALALHVEDNECGVAVLRSHGFQVLSQSDISR